MLSLTTKAQLDEFLNLIKDHSMITVKEVSDTLKIRFQDAEKLFEILEAKELVEIVGKPDYVGLTRKGRNFKLESKFLDTKKRNMEQHFNVYLGYAIANTDRIIIGIFQNEVESLAEAFEAGVDSLFIAGTKYELSTLAKIRIFRSDRPEEYNDYLSFKAGKEEVIWNRFNEVLFHVNDLSHFGVEVTRDFIKHNFGAKKEKTSSPPNGFDLDVFISHSHKDKEVAKSIAELISKAFNLTNDRIRCTSAAGFKFKGGTKTMETLRSEVERSKLLIVIISENAVKSHYVLFELGARWGLQMSHLPLFYNEEGASLLPGPLSNIIGLAMSDNSDMHQFITDVSEYIDVKPQQPKVYNQLINELVLHVAAHDSQKSIQSGNHISP